MIKQQQQRSPRLRPGAMRGFNMIELMVVIAIAAILGAMAVPGFKDTIDRNARESSMQDLMSAIGRARSEAVAQSRYVTVCRSTSLTDCAASSGSDWNVGWIIFTDAGATVGRVDTGDTIVQVHGASNGQSAIVLQTRNNGNFTGDYLRFDNNGFLASTDSTTGTGAWFRLCSLDKVVTKARSIWMSSSGRPTLGGKAAGANGVYKRLDGTAITCP